MSEEISIKIHRSYRNVVALCDSELIGKKFEEGKRQLDIRESFYSESKVDEEKALEILRIQSNEDPTFNIVGEKAISVSLKVGIISQANVDKIQGVPFALTLI